MVRKDRVCSGGILIYVEQHLNYRRIPELELPSIEAIFIKLQFSNGNILVGFIYRPPNNNLVNYSEWPLIMDNLLDKVNNTCNKVILLGDFNIDLLPTAVEKTSWINTFQSYYLNQLIDEPTRITSHSKTLLDHIYVSEDVNVSKSGLLSWAISDHNPIYITINKSNYVTNHDKLKNKHKTIRYRKLADVDINTLGPCILDTLNFIDNSKDTNVNDLTSSWTCRVLSILDTHWPVRTKRIKKEHQPGWLTADIRKLMKERDTFKSGKSLVKYKELRNKCKKEIKKAKSKYYINLIETNKNNQNIISKIFQDLGSKIKHRKTINKLPVDGNDIDSQESIGNELNQHFTTLIDKLIGQNGNERPNFTILAIFVNAKLSPGTDYNIPPISHEFVFKFISSLKSSKATGLDGTSAKYLKMFAPYITVSVVKLCNVSIVEGQFPDS